MLRSRLPLRVSLLVIALLFVTASSARAEEVDNPRYARWAQFAVGSSATYTGEVSAAGFKGTMESVYKLAEKTDMGAGFIVMENATTGRTSIRYGLTGKVTEEQEEAAKKASAKPEANLSFAEQLALKKQNLRKIEGTPIDPGPPLTPEQVQSRIMTALKARKCERFCS